jgi:hypothetical protein
MVIVRPVQREDAAIWLRMRCALWPDGSRAEHRDGVERFLGIEAHRACAFRTSVS